MPDLDTGLVIQVDVEDNAASLIERGVILEGLSGTEENALKAVPPQEPLHASQHAGVIIDDKYDLI
jgi:hypothetical protein